MRRNIIAQSTLISLMLLATIFPKATFAQQCSNASLAPALPDLGQNTHQYHYWESSPDNPANWTTETLQGGLYQNGSNQPPTNHFQTGLDIARNQIDPDQQVIVISVGMSNTGMEFGHFVNNQFQTTPGINPNVRLVQAAQSSRVVNHWDEPTDTTWSEAVSRVGSNNVNQVQVAWIKLAKDSPNYNADHIDYLYEGYNSSDNGLVGVLHAAKTTFPNLKLALVSSRTGSSSIFDLSNYDYTGRGGLNSEPFAFEGGFATRRLILEQANNPTGRLNLTQAPLAIWGPYIWADGLNSNGTPITRSDNLTWTATDLNDDCTHPSQQGEVKVADQLLSYFMSSPLTAPWFLETPQETNHNISINQQTVSTNPLTVNFSSTNASGYNHYWFFDDALGSLETNPNKRFTTPGTYTIRLTTVNPTTGTSYLTTSTLQVGDEPPPPSTPGDYDPYPDGDNDVDIDDFWEVITQFFNRTYSIFDFNQVVANFNTNNEPPPEQLTIQFTPDEGTFTSPVTLDLFVPETPDYQIYYTLDGSDPNNSDNGTLYQGDLTLEQTTTVKARAYATNFTTSEIYQKTYTIESQPNQAPSANNQQFTTQQNTDLSLTLSYTDPDGPGPYTFNILSQPQNGTLTGTGDSRTYTPDTNYTGTDSFTWNVNDGELDSNTATVSINITNESSNTIIFDHSMVVPPEDMNQIPIEYLDIARNRRVFFRHASVGFNIWDGLECMQSQNPSNLCDRNIPDGIFINDPNRYHIPNFAKFSTTSQWVEECHTLNTSNCNPGWIDKALYFYYRLTESSEMQPTSDYPQLASIPNMDILMFKFGNVDDSTNSFNASINGENGYFVEGSTNTDIHEIAAWEMSHPSQTVVYWTMGLGRIATTTSKTYNQNLRAYAQNNDKIVFDFSSILSRRPNGDYCYYPDLVSTNPLSNEVPNICDEYTNEVNGGHLNSWGKARVAQSLWAFMARLAGWSGNY